MKSLTETKVGIRTGHFSNTVILLAEVLELESIYHDQKEEFAQFKLPSGQTLEVFGPKNIWHPFTTPPDLEVIIADIRDLKEKKKL